MVLEQDKIVANTKKYFATATKLGFMNDEFMSFLGEDFIKAPASTSTRYNNAFEGGLIDHLLNVTKYAVLINDSLPVDEQVDKNSLVKVCLLHQIGKAFLFSPITWKSNTGVKYDFNEDTISMRVSERSINYIFKHGITLTDEEYAAILNFDKVDDKMAEHHNTMLGDLLKMGSILAIKHEKKIAK
jgi:hypothetical protein